MRKFKTLVMLCIVICLTVLSQSVSAATTIQGKIVNVGRVTGLKSGVCTTKSVNIHWEPVAGASGYEIYRSVARNGKYYPVGTASMGSQAFMNTSVAEGKEYYYKVRAYVSSGNGKNYGKFSKIVRTNTKQSFKKTVTPKCNINIRKYAGIQYSRICGAVKGTKMKVLCEACDKLGVKWYRIQIKLNQRKYKGYIRSDLAV